MVHSQPRKESPGRSRRKPAIDRATAWNTSWPTSATSCRDTPACRHQLYTVGPYRPVTPSQAWGSLALRRCSRLVEVDVVAPSPPPPLGSTLGAFMVPERGWRRVPEVRHVQRRGATRASVGAEPLPRAQDSRVCGGVANG